MASVSLAPGQAEALRASALKHCFNCDQTLSFSCFYKNKKREDGLQTQCKTCMLQRAKDWYIDNTSRHKKIGQEYYRTHKSAVLEYVKRWRNENLLQHKEKQKAWKKNNPHKLSYYSGKRRAQIINACPSWLTKEHWDQIFAIYEESRRLTDLTGIPHEVDHIHPLLGKTCSGLHVPWNLRVVTAHANRSKGNRLEIE